MRKSFAILAAIALAVLVSTGCHFRKETIVVHPDGSAEVTYRVEGDKEDILSGDALPMALGWEITEKSEDPAKGEHTYVWTAEFGDLNEYPRNFARPGDPHSGVYLQTETRLQIEEHPGRTLYRFTRRYIGRRAGKFQELQELAVPEDLLERVNEEGEDALTLEEREKLFGGLAEYEGISWWFRIWNALGRTVEAGVLGLSERETVLEGLIEYSEETYLEEQLTSDYLQNFFSLSDEEQELEKPRMMEGPRAELIRLLPPGRVDEVLFFVDHEELAFEVTEDLNDESFSLTVELPGTVISSNALDINNEKAVSWEFDGNQLQEGDLILTAVSVVEHR